MKAIKGFLGAIIIVLVLTILDREIGKEQEPMQKKNTGKWMLFCILSLALLGLMNKCLNAQTLDSVSVEYSTEVQYPLAGITVCDTVKNFPMIKLHTAVKGELLIIILKHEKIHARRMIAFKGGCNAFQAKYTKDFMFRVTEEAEAYCGAEFNVAKAREFRLYWADKIATTIFEQIRGQVAYSTVKSQVYWRCGVPRDPP